MMGMGLKLFSEFGYDGQGTQTHLFSNYFWKHLNKYLKAPMCTKFGCFFIIFLKKTKQNKTKTNRGKIVSVSIVFVKICLIFN